MPRRLSWTHSEGTLMTSAPLTPPLTHIRPKPWADRAWATLACAVTTALAWPLHQWLDPANTVMLFLLTVALVANWLGRGPAVLSAFLSVASFDFFFVPPRWSLAVTDAQYLLTFAVMLAVALIISHLSEGLRQQALQAEERAQQTHSLYDLARALAGSLTDEHIEALTRAFVARHLHAQARLLVPDECRRSLRCVDLALPALAPTVLAAALSVDQTGQARESSHLGLDEQAHLMLPLRGATRHRGVLMISAPAHQGQRLSQAMPLAEALASLVSASIERVHFVEVAQATQVQASSERLRASILSALSHDIRTPLTALYGTADTLALTHALPAQAQELALSVRDQAMRLHQMVIKLLDMARLHAGHVSLHREWQPLEEVVGASIQSLGTALSDHPVQVTLAAELPLVFIDAVLFERVLSNLLENAAKYSPAHTPIVMEGWREDDTWVIAVRNQGEGFPPDKLQRVFELFERGTQESSVPGVGLGLAICRAIVEAHEGRIEASNQPGGGAEVRITLPCGEPPAIEAEVLP
jgi:two-component system sensor histidine kinase KdpD